MTLDVVDIDRRGNARNQIKLSQVTRQMRKILDAVAVALEVPVVNRIEADQRRKQSPIRFCRHGADQIRAVGEPRFDLIERVKQSCE